MQFLAIQLPRAYRRQVLITVQVVVVVALVAALIVASLTYSLAVRAVLVTSLLVVATGLWLSRHGGELIGAHLLLTTVLVLATTLAMRGQGINDVAFAIMPALLLLGGLLLPLRQYFLVVALIVCSVLLVAGSTAAGWIRPTHMFTGLPSIWGEAAALLVILLAEAAMVLILVTGVLRFFAESERQRHALLVAHDALRAENHERQQAEAAVRNLNAELEQRVVERTADLQHLINELDAFNYSVSHDLRAPLRAITGFSQAAAEELLTNPDEAIRYLKKTQSAGNQMNILIDDLLRLSRTSTQALQWKPVVLEEVIARLIHELPEAEQQWVQFDRNNARIAVAADAGLLRLALTNLLSNALKYSRQQQPPAIHITVEHGMESAVIHIRDNGIGFSVSDAARLFKPFSRLDNAIGFDGTGIGLAIVRRVVERHHGRIWADSQPGHGACFSMALPVQN